MAKQQKPITEAAQAVASTAAPVAPVSGGATLLTLETAAEAGLTLTPAGIAPPADAGEAPERLPEEEEPLRLDFSLDLFRRALAQIPDEHFDDALDAMMSEGLARGVISTDDPDQLLDEVPADEVPADEQPVDEHATARELLQRYKLPKAWQCAEGHYYFDEKAALAANATTEILPEA